MFKKHKIWISDSAYSFIKNNIKSYWFLIFYHNIFTNFVNRSIDWLLDRFDTILLIDWSIRLDRLFYCAGVLICQELSGNKKIWLIEFQNPSAESANLTPLGWISFLKNCVCLIDWSIDWLFFTVLEFRFANLIWLIDRLIDWLFF